MDMCGRVWRNDDGYIGRRMLKIELPGKTEWECLKGGLWILDGSG